jgi:hypothetical protein
MPLGGGLRGRFRQQPIAERSGGDQKLTSELPETKRESAWISRRSLQGELKAWQSRDTNLNEAGPLACYKRHEFKNEFL